MIMITIYSSFYCLNVEHVPYSCANLAFRTGKFDINQVSCGRVYPRNGPVTCIRQNDNQSECPKSLCLPRNLVIHLHLSLKFGE